MTRVDAFTLVPCKSVIHHLLLVFGWFFLSDNSITFYEYLEVHLCNKFMSQLF